MPTLDDRYLTTEGTVYLTGIQALVRLLLDQRRLDRARGLRTAGFISGYEGSPLAGYDLELGRQRKLLAEHDLVHRPGLNEEIAATAVQGSQLAGTRPDARYDGVFGVWYGKAPGLDRATDALRHANLAGTDPAGGALALVGDDPVAKSSTVPSASERVLADLGIPTLYPADSQDILDLGLHALALSRASGLWTAMKLVTNVADGGGTAEVGLNRIEPIDPGSYRHEITPKLVGAAPVAAETTAFGVRMRIAREYAARNGLNVLHGHGGRVGHGGHGGRVGRIGHDGRVGIAAAGKTYLDVRQALLKLGVDGDAIRLLKVGMIHPLEPAIVKEFATGLEEIIVVEEKRPFLESAIKDVLYGTPDAPRISGKRDPDGAPLLRETAELDAETIAKALAARLDLPGPRERIEVRRSLPLAARTPYFCSGCPHNRSTRVPEGSLVGAGIGCHAMVLMMDPEQVGDVVGLTQMGGEGAQWLGMGPFVETGHLLQNLGDGTFHHSGSLAIRAAVAAGADITFKILYNSAVAMTGGQSAVGQRTVPQLTELLKAEGVGRIIVTTEDPGRYRRVKLARGVQVRHRDELAEAQRELAGTPGVTVLVHDQQCAAEKRRDRRRGRAAQPETRVVINERVCEGCGDCGTKSNCLSVQPVPTEYGRKTRIHQTSCNADYSCLDGDCPSFVTVRPGRRSKPESAPAVDPPDEPEPAVDADDFTVRITGIGGTGVVTIAQILAAAAHLDGRHVSTLDQTGLSQKGGAVVSDLKVSRDPVARANKATAGECDLYLGCDLLVAVDEQHLAAADPSRTVAVVSTAQVPTGRMVIDTAASFPETAELTARIAGASRAGSSVFVDARELSVREFGDDQCANVLLLGAAYQTGALPLPLPALRDAITLNGVAVETNLRAFDLGRRAAVRRPAEDGQRDVAVAADLVGRHAPELASAPAELRSLVARRAADLVAYQNAAYAGSYVAEVARVYRAEAAGVPGGAELTGAVARNLHKLMAYKDEYEVARLCLDPAFAERIAAEFGPDARFAWRLHPPVLRALGLKRKIALGPWARPALVPLRAARRVRGTRLDIFGMTRVRRVERELIGEYRAAVAGLLAGLRPGNHELAVRIAGLPDMVRGYEQIKLDNVARYRASLAGLRAEFDETTVVTGR